MAALNTRLLFLRQGRKFFRVAFTDHPSTRSGELEFDVSEPIGRYAAPHPNPNFEISELVLHSAPRSAVLRRRRLLPIFRSFDPYPTPAVDAADAIRKEDVIDLTAKMQPDGTLNWTPPAGTWWLMRFG